MTCAERIDRLLKERKMSRRQLAIKAGIPTSTFQSAMQRNGNMSYEMLEKIANALGIELFEFFGEAGEMIFVSGEASAVMQYVRQGYEFDAKEKLLVRLFHLLNEEGQDTALDRMCELTEIPKYKIKED